MLPNPQFLRIWSHLREILNGKIIFLYNEERFLETHVLVRHFMLLMDVYIAIAKMHSICLVLSLHIPAQI